ncbi:Multifunctional methyltransferase subunit trm112 [Ophiocordyceps camponoti-floridani]|uniref:Multifunctional methyltransferase subunit trm112 n=1 Tax=Ophiocordyceps camponoti-floridani TaxID=2030778 RepID=A0A8H4Q4E2_9HYPO|nr:Multifunctional methyltransferase subunit trm112 [Ophiocordyceps camponoti-floridani]
MKVLTLNFLTCAVKACKTSSASYPLHPRDAELVQDDIDINPEMLVNLLPRLDWAALRETASELGFPDLPEQPPAKETLQADEVMQRDLHHLLFETQISEGKLVCGNCGHDQSWASLYELWTSRYLSTSEVHITGHAGIGSYLDL